MNKIEICRRIPHAGAMCLLHRVDHWDADTIVCSALSHADADNPLRSRDRLHAVCGVEYAAQAMAVHGSLLHRAAHDKPGIGFLASVRDLRLFIERLDQIKETLVIQAHRLNSVQGITIYQFDIAAAGRNLLAGRIAVKIILDGDK